MGWIRRAWVLLLALAVLAGSAGAEYYGSVPGQEVYLTQSRKHTCTLIAAAMMLRSYAENHGLPVEQFSEGTVAAEAWRDGLLWDFTVRGINVQCVHGISQAEDPGAYLVLFLRWHPEGVVIYDVDQPHAIWLFGYDEATDTFYCADTATRAAGRGIPLVEASLRGATQEAILGSIDRIWYVTGTKAQR